MTPDPNLQWKLQDQSKQPYNLMEPQKVPFINTESKVKDFALKQ